jgi:hypothetical protein
MCISDLRYPLYYKPSWHLHFSSSSTVLARSHEFALAVEVGSIIYESATREFALGASRLCYVFYVLETEGQHIDKNHKRSSIELGMHLYPSMHVFTTLIILAESTNQSKS